MRNVLAAAIVATVITGSVVSSQRPASQEAPTNKTLALRNAVLSRELFKKLAPRAPGTIRAVVYDWDVDDGTATLVTFEDGATSVYLSTGGGVIGAGKHEAVRRAAAAFRDEAARVRDSFTPATTFPLPDRGKSRVYLVTDTATLQSAAFSDAEVRAQRHPLQKLVQLGQDVFTAVREASSK